MFDFIRNRRLFYLLSAVLIIPGVISLVLPGGLNPGIDFTSGTIMTIQFDNPVDQSALRDAFAQIDHPEAIVQASGDNTFIVRTRPLQQAQQTDAGDLGQSERQQIEQALTSRFGSLQILNLDQVSPLIASEIVRDAVIAVAAASVFILLYLWWAFNKVTHPWRYGTTAVVALIHDALVVLGIFSILGRLFPGEIELESTFIVAVLTVIGFSVHDTIVVFDRIRENFIRRAGEPFEDVVNHSLAQTLTRSLNTSLTVLLTLFVLMLFGGTTIRYTFVLPLLIGITTGTYSSIFVASMLLVSWHIGELRRLWPFSRRELRPARA
ncbi:MAG: protein translocase subunit SecF [Chloroflexi bacterium]|nr:protein translocase subunit SecF [Chloroflexota bacterium]MBV9547032.1 protein translocase subunit SecF [Chloroflexota bacterium]